MITFIVPSFNQGIYIKYALDSILINMVPEDQLIIQDGASTDCTAEEVKPYLADPRVAWFSEPDSGFSEAISKALARARNPIIGIQSSDDAYLPDIRKKVIDNFANPDTVIVYADYEHIDVQNRKLGEWRHRAGSLTDIVSLRTLLPQSSLFFRKAALDGLKILDLDYDYVADVVLFNQIAMQGKSHFVPEIWSQVRIQPDCRTGKRNPGTQYLKAIDTVLTGLTLEQKKKAHAAGLLLRSRYEASSMQRGKALVSLLSALNQDFTLINHWIFPRAIRYILIGPNGVRIYNQLRYRKSL